MKPILCLDFDGVLHSYTSGWKGADIIPDAPVPGAIEFICSAVLHFRVAIFSSRSNEVGGIAAMHSWLHHHFCNAMLPEVADNVIAQIEWPSEKPPAFVTIDDRALTFTGAWPSIDALKNFVPWNKTPTRKTIAYTREITRHRANPLNDTISLLVVDEPGAGGANHEYDVVLPSGKTTRISFQNGPIAEAGVNGLTQEVLLSIVFDRLQGFQGGPFACEDNAEALYHVANALVALQRRTRERMARGVEGTNVA